MISRIKQIIVSIFSLKASRNHDAKDLRNVKWIQRLDIFVSSPGDVSAERDIVLRVIERLNRLTYIRKKYLLNPLLWENEVPAQVGDPAQVIVDRYMLVEDSYLLICFMWNRIGTEFVHPKTKKRFLSGTEYEFTMGYQRNQEIGKPLLLLYRKMQEDDNANKADKALVDNFFKKFEANEATLKGLYGKFSSPIDFEEKLFRDIEKIIDKYPPQIDKEDLIASDTRPNIVEESRRLDVAMPKECHVNKATEIRVMICLTSSEGLKEHLPDYTAEGDRIDKRDVQYGTLAVAFPLDKKTGSPLPILASIEIKGEGFEIAESIQEIRLLHSIDSGLFTFSLVPITTQKRALVHVIVKSKTPDGYIIILGSASLHTEVKPINLPLSNEGGWTTFSLALSSFPLVIEHPSQTQINISSGSQIRANTKLFISYRRSDSGAEARLLYDKLALEFSRENIFADIGSISFGENFEEKITDRITESDVVLVLIGENWLEVLNEHIKRRESDYMLNEVAFALKTGKRVVPILLGNAKMPDRTQLPSSLKQLSNLNVLHTSLYSFESDIEYLISQILSEKKS